MIMVDQQPHSFCDPAVGETIIIPSGVESEWLYRKLLGVQKGEDNDPHGWRATVPHCD